MFRKALKALTLMAMFHLSLNHHHHVEPHEEYHGTRRKAIYGIAR